MALLACSTFAFGQKVTLHHQDQPLKVILEDVTRQTGFSLAYSSQFVNLNTTANVTADQKELDPVLAQLFSGTDIGYRIKGKEIYLFNKEQQPAGVSKQSKQQVRTISGTVKDKNGETIIGANVLIKGSANEKLVNEYLKISPIAIECCFQSFSPQVNYLLQKIRNTHTKIWINSLWPSLNAGHDDDLAVESNKPNEAWGWIISQGATLIQTDRPKNLLEYLSNNFSQ